MVADQDCGLAPGTGGGGGTAAPGRRAVDDVVVDEGGGVGELDRDRGRGHPVKAVFAQVRAEQDQGRPQTLASTRKEVGHGRRGGRVVVAKRAADHLLQPRQVGRDRPEGRIGSGTHRDRRRSPSGVPAKSQISWGGKVGSSPRG